MKILYLSCHEIHEFDELRILNDLGYYVFCPGRPHVSEQWQYYQRPNIPNTFNLEDDSNALHKDFLQYKEKYPNFNYKKNKIDPIHRHGCLTKEFIDRFDVIIVMSLFKEWIYNNWSVLKNKIVIWRTNGQSSEPLEQLVKTFRSDNPNLKIMRYSPAERNYKNYAGEDVMIRFGKKSEEWGNWAGNNNRVISLSQNVIDRSVVCSWDIIRYIGERVPYTLFGHNNINNKYWSGQDLEYNELTQVLQDYKCYFYNGSKPACYTLNFIEAWMTGIPIVAIGNQLGNDTGLNNYEIPSLIENGVSGFYSDKKDELVDYCKTLLNDEKLAHDISQQGRKKSIELFGYEPILNQWKDFFSNL